MDTLRISFGIIAEFLQLALETGEDLVLAETGA